MEIAIYRKYRPKLWAEIIGQEHITKTLQNEIGAGRVVHSYLFTGSRGIGKTTIARLLAKSLNCTGRGESSEPCNGCENCQAASHGNSLNIIEIDAASHTGVDNVRDKIIENARFLPAGAKYKIFIIDEAHMLSGAAFNALLKTLEEPPAHIVFILATTELQKIPATILSRCQRFDFKKLSSKEIIFRLEKLAESEGVKISKKILERIAHLAEGGLRDAESLFGQILGLGLTDIKEEDADLVLPRADFSAALSFLEFLVSKNGREALLLTQDLNERGADFKYFLDNAIELARELLYVKITGKAETAASDDFRKSLERMSESAPLQDIIKILDIFIARRGDMRLLNIPSLPLELVAAEICGDPSAVIARPQAEAIPSNAGSPRPSASSGLAMTETSGDISQIIDKWPEVLERIKVFNHSLPFILKISEPRGYDGKNLFLAIKYKLHKDKLEDRKNYAILTEVLQSVYNKEIFVRPEVDTALSVSVPSEEEEVSAEDAFGAG